MTEFVGLHTRLKPGMEEAYDAAHTAVWPGLLEAQRAVGIKRWLIFRDGLEVFHAIECDDYDYAIAELAKLPINQSWQAAMAHYTEVAHDYSGAASDRLLLIFNAGISAAGAERVGCGAPLAGVPAIAPDPSRTGREA